MQNKMKSTNVLKANMDSEFFEHYDSRINVFYVVKNSLLSFGQCDIKRYVNTTSISLQACL